jgi:hypothetical protein
MGNRRGVYKILKRKAEEKGPLGKGMHKWEDNIKMDHRDVK